MVRSSSPILFFFFFNDTATTEIYTLSLHDALPISVSRWRKDRNGILRWLHREAASYGRWKEVTSNGREAESAEAVAADRKSTRLNSSHSQISYAVFCLKKKKKTQDTMRH